MLDWKFRPKFYNYNSQLMLWWYSKVSMWNLRVGVLNWNTTHYLYVYFDYLEIIWAMQWNKILKWYSRKNLSRKGKRNTTLFQTVNCTLFYNNYTIIFIYFYFPMQETSNYQCCSPPPYLVVACSYFLPTSHWRFMISNFLLHIPISGIVYTKMLYWQWSRRQGIAFSTEPAGALNNKWKNIAKCCPQWDATSNTPQSCSINANHCSSRGRRDWMKILCRVRLVQSGWRTMRESFVLGSNNVDISSSVILGSCPIHATTTIPSIVYLLIVILFLILGGGRL